MNRRAGAAAAFLAAASFAFASPAAAGSGTKATEEYITANVINMNPGAARNTGRLTVRVFDTTSDERRGALLKVLAEKGSEALVEALREEPPVGTMAFTGTLAYDLRYSRVIQQGDTRHLILATDRPITAGEVRQNARSLEKGVTIVHLQFGPDEKGKIKGTGEMLMGAELSLDAATGDLSVEHLGIEPWRLTLATSKIKKKK
jgi:hypothetical protein